LPDKPYKQFFGRQDSINKILETLIRGGTFIASIDGVGGIGKTALAHYFCKEIVLPSNQFDYLVWLTAKETVFDPFSSDLMIKTVRSSFRGIEELIDATLSVIKFEELIDKPLEEKKKFVEDEVLKSEKIFFVLDNLESVDDNQFFDYITHDFNKFAAENKFLKVLTTSRKRKKIVDFPIEIEGLAIEDALKMLKYLASEHNIKDILNATDHDNIRLIERVGGIPLGIEFIVGQMSLGKSRGQIYDELLGYPSLKNARDESEKRKVLSDIILFSFKDMYETLTDKEQYVFKVIAALVTTKRQSDPPTSFELLMTMTGYRKEELENYLENLRENNLINVTKENEYTLPQMAINFVRQYYEDFWKIEDEIVEKKNKIIKNNYKALDKVDLFLNSVRGLIDSNRFEEAEAKLIDASEVIPNSRIYFELAKVQKNLNKFLKAGDSFRIATELNPKDVKIWTEWINMEDSRGRHNIALQISEQALEKTNNDVSLVIQRINILASLKEFDQLRGEVKHYLGIYDNEQRKDDYLRLLRNWKNIEFSLVQETIIHPKYYFEAVETLIGRASDIERKIRLYKEALRVADGRNDLEKKKSFDEKMRNLESKLLEDIPSRTKRLMKLFKNGNYDEAKGEARKILSLAHEDNEHEEYAEDALQILLRIFMSQKDYDRVIMTFEDYEKIGYRNQGCIDIYEEAKKEKKKREKEEIMSKISINIQNCEMGLRQLIMWSLDYEEERLIELVKNKGKQDWIDQWKFTKDKSLKKGEALIYYSDLSHLRSIISWIRPEIINKVIDNSKKDEANELLRNIVAYLENYITKERNESFHSRLQLYEKDELSAFLVDTERTLEEINKLKDLVGW